MATESTTETAILARIIAPDDPGLNRQFAQAVLSFAFRPDDQERMQQLSEKASEGTLTPDEQEEMDSYERVGHFISILQSKARMSLKRITPDRE